MSLAQGPSMRSYRVDPDPDRIVRHVCIDRDPDRFCNKFLPITFDIPHQTVVDRDTVQSNNLSRPTEVWQFTQITYKNERRLTSTLRDLIDRDPDRVNQEFFSC